MNHDLDYLYDEVYLGDEDNYDDEYDNDDDRQPDEYTEWQDLYGGDDWDNGQFDCEY